MIGPRPLVVGYGNSLRRDDGVGWHAAGLLAADPRFAGCDVRQEFQLLPELACDVARASVVVLIDAREAYDVAPGQVSHRAVRPDSRGGGISSHHVTPEALLALAALTLEPTQPAPELPPVLLVEVAAREFDDGADTLTPAVAAALPHVLDRVADLLRAPAPPAPPPPPGRTAPDRDAGGRPGAAPRRRR